MTAADRNEAASHRANADPAGTIIMAGPDAIADHLTAWPPTLPDGDRDPDDLGRHGVPPDDAHPVNFLATPYGRRFLVMVSAGENADGDDGEHTAGERAQWYPDADYWTPDAAADPAVIAMRALDNAQTLAAWQNAALRIEAATTDAERARATHAMGVLGDPDEHVVALVKRLARLPETPDSTSGLSLLTHIVERLPEPVSVETRADRRIMPTLKVVGPASERERGVLFGGLVEDRPHEVDLPLFPDLEAERHRVPLLELVDATGAPVRSEGKGAPLEARLIVRGGLLMIRPEDRGRAFVRIAVEVGELVDGLYPRRRRLTRNWPKIKTALRVARDFTVTDATGGRWFPMALRRLPVEGPDGTPAADDLVVLDLAPPPGAANGATVDLPALDLMGVSSGPKWRAYIAARSLVWSPGKTRRPAPRRGRGQYGWSTNPDDYPVVLMADLRRLAFGDRDEKHRTKAEIVAPWMDLPDVIAVPATDPQTGNQGYRLLPAEAVEAVRQSDPTGES